MHTKVAPHAVHHSIVCSLFVHLVRAAPKFDFIQQTILDCVFFSQKLDYHWILLLLFASLLLAIYAMSRNWVGYLHSKYQEQCRMISNHGLSTLQAPKHLKTRKALPTGLDQSCNLQHFLQLLITWCWCWCWWCWWGSHSRGDPIHSTSEASIASFCVSAFLLSRPLFSVKKHTWPIC